MSARFPVYDNARPIIAYDCETALFSPGNMAPLVSCYSFAWREGEQVKTAILDHVEGLAELHGLLDRAIAGEITIAGQNLPYDVACPSNDDFAILLKFFDAYELGAVHCTMAAEWLLDTAAGLLRMEWNEDKEEYSSKKSYSLENLARIYLGQAPYKDEWRLRYGELRGVPLGQWPERAREYPQQDAEFTFRIAEKQRDAAARVVPHDPLVAALAHVCRTYLALHLTSVWGEELDPERVALLDKCVRAYSDGFVPALEEAGLVVRVKKGKKAGTLTKKKAPLKRMIVEDLIARGALKNDDGLVAIDDILADPASWLDDDNLTDGGKSGVRGVKTAHEVIVDCVDPRLKTMALFLKADKMRSSFTEPAMKFQSGPTHSRYMFAETGRTTCSGGGKRSRSGFNVQQMDRKLPKGLAAWMERELGYEIEQRSCFMARPGWVQSSSDYSALEMCTWAQACTWLVGYSDLAEAINRGVDAHTLFASDMLHCSYEDALARVKAKEPEAVAARQRAKVGNFGIPGGIGAPKFQKYAKKEDVHIPLDEVKEIKRLFLARWTEAKPYFDLGSEAVNGGESTMVGLVSGMLRGGVGYTDWCNGNFQELAAYGATDALWTIVRECYDERLKSDLWGSRCVAFIHDDYRLEHPEDRAHEAATRAAEIAREVMQGHCPDVRIKIEPALSRRWYKGVQTVRDEHGRLQIWEP